MKDDSARGERLRNLFVGAIVLVAIALAVAPKFKFEPTSAPRLDLAA